MFIYQIIQLWNTTMTTHRHCQRRLIHHDDDNQHDAPVWVHHHLDAYKRDHHHFNTLAANSHDKDDESTTRDRAQDA